MENIIKIGSVELYESEVQKLYEAKKYLVCYKKIWQIHYSQNAGYYGQCVYTETKGNLAKRGRFHTMSASEVNHLLGFNLLNEEVA